MLNIWRKGLLLIILLAAVYAVSSWGNNNDTGPLAPDLTHII